MNKANNLKLFLKLNHTLHVHEELKYIVLYFFHKAVYRYFCSYVFYYHFLKDFI